MLILGGVLQFTGCALPFLILIHKLESTFFLNFLAYGLTVVGMFIGAIGLANYMHFQRKK
jgi:hypothetical protein